MWGTLPHMLCLVSMRRITNYLLGLLALILLLPACKSNSDVEEPTLELSTSSLTFAREASEQTLTVQTNREDSWMATSPKEGEWLTLKQEGLTLRVIAKANTTAETRSTVIIVSAGGLQRKVLLQQRAGDPILNLSQTSVSLPVKGGRQTITYTSNAEDLKVEVPASATSWLSVTENVRGSFTLVAQPNTDPASRSAQLSLTIGSVVREMEVIQEGTSPFILPLLSFPARLYSVMSYEQGRGHYVLEAQPGDEDRPTIMRFITQSEAIPFVQYEFTSSSSPSYYHAMMLYLDQSLVKDNAAFDASLKAYGLVKEPTEKDAQRVLYKSEKPEQPVQLLVTFFTGGARLDFVYMPRQPQAYETFATVPMTRMIPFLGSRPMQIPGKKRADVRAFELGEGNEPLPGTPDSHDLFEPKTPFDGENMRAYLYVVSTAKNNIPKNDPYIDVVGGLVAFYDNLHLGLWEDKIDGKVYPTHQFFTLLTKAGYTYLGQLKDGAHAFRNKETRLAYILSPAENDGMNLLEIMVVYMSDQGGGSARLQLDHKRAMKHLGDELSYLYQMHSQYRHLRRR